MIRKLVRRTLRAVADIAFAIPLSLAKNAIAQSIQRTEGQDLELKLLSALAGKDSVTLKELLVALDIRPTELTPKKAGELRLALTRLGWERTVVIDNEGGHTAWRCRS